MWMDGNGDELSDLVFDVPLNCSLTTTSSTTVTATDITTVKYPGHDRECDSSVPYTRIEGL